MEFDILKPDGHNFLTSFEFITMEQTPTWAVTKFQNNQQEEYHSRDAWDSEMQAATQMAETGAQGSGASDSNFLHFPKLLSLQEMSNNWEREKTS